MQATAVAHSNVALVKYWGKRNVDDGLNLPAVGSISVSLGALTTRTTVRFDSSLKADTVQLREGAGVLPVTPAVLGRTSAFLDLVRQRAGIGTAAAVETENDFPTAAGLASSASGFAALAVAASGACGLELNRDELSVLARRGSGSAARSIFGGFVEMAKGEAAHGSDSVAHELAPASHWPLEVVVAVTHSGPKALGSTAGMERTRTTSPYYEGWLQAQEHDLRELRNAIAARDFTTLAAVTEHSCMKMHGLMHSARPPISYWNSGTVAAMQAIHDMRADDVPVCFTIDAGPQVKAVCLPEAAEHVAERLAAVSGVSKVIRSPLGEGARLVDDGQGAGAS